MEQVLANYRFLYLNADKIQSKENKCHPINSTNSITSKLQQQVNKSIDSSANETLHNEVSPITVRHEYGPKEGNSFDIEMVVDQDV